METVEHPRRPARLDSSGELIVHSAALETDCIVWFPIPNGAPGSFEAEGIPARRIDGDRAVLTGIPYFPYHAALGDEMSIREHEGSLYAVEVAIASQELTVRIFHEENSIPIEQAISDPKSDERFWGLIRALAAHGCWFERFSTSYSAFSVAPEEWEYVEAFLDLRQRTGDLQFELATPLRA